MKRTKIFFTILPICLIGIATILFKFNDTLSDKIELCVYGIISTIIVIPLMYRIPIKHKIASGITRGALGTFLIMFLTGAISTGVLEKDIIETILKSPLIAMFLPLYMLEFFYFTFGTITVFLIVDYCVKTDTKKAITA